jgi:hypothetical protein
MFTIGIGALIAWRLISRVRRMVGRQRATTVRPWISVVLFPLLLVMLAFVALANPPSLAGLALGAIAGAVLGIIGLRLTRFESGPDGLFYTPNPYLGVALAVLLVARLGWRFFRLYGAGGGMSMDQPPDFARSPLTLVIFGMLAGYYTVYSGGLLRWQARVAQSSASQPVPGVPPTGPV